MNLGVMFAAGLLMFMPQTNLPTQTMSLRNTFVVATETVIDNANAVDVNADDVRFDAQMQELKTSKENLARMASDDRERDVVATTNDLLFIISACHLQYKNGAKTGECAGQIGRARDHVMSAINKHKSGGAWVDGPPA